MLRLAENGRKCLREGCLIFPKSGVGRGVFILITGCVDLT